MRLVCPNCSAQYEIDGSMIPDGGRDVQCSNCGHTWFELPPADNFGDMAPEDFDAPIAEPGDLSEGDDATDGGFSTDDIVEAEPIDVDDVTEDEVAEESKADESVDPEDEDKGLSSSSAVAAAAAAALAGDRDENDTMAARPQTQRRPADAAALDILREEAERELSQRRTPPSETIETQTDLGLEDIRKRQTPSRALRARMAAMGEETDTEEAPESEPRQAPAGATRLADSPAGATRLVEAPSGPPPTIDDKDDYKKPQRDVLPDIDEINSTLKPAPRQAQGGRRGFFMGFVMMVGAAVALIVAYAQAPALANAFPNAEPTLIAYVDRANAFRDWIGALLGG